MAKAAARPAKQQQDPERTQTTLRLDVSMLIALKKLAADRRIAVNDLVVEALEALLSRPRR